MCGFTDSERVVLNNLPTSMKTRVEDDTFNTASDVMKIDMFVERLKLETIQTLENGGDVVELVAATEGREEVFSIGLSIMKDVKTKIALVLGIIGGAVNQLIVLVGERDM